MKQFQPHALEYKCMCLFGVECDNQYSFRARTKISLLTLEINLLALLLNQVLIKSSITNHTFTIDWNYTVSSLLREPTSYNYKLDLYCYDTFICNSAQNYVMHYALYFWACRNWILPEWSSFIEHESFNNRSIVISKWGKMPDN